MLKDKFGEQVVLLKSIIRLCDTWDITTWLYMMKMNFHDPDVLPWWKYIISAA